MNLEQCVKDFQKHVGASAPAFPSLSKQDSGTVLSYAKMLRNASSTFKMLYKTNNNNVFLRIELMLEELGESLEGIAENDKVKTLDGLVDCAYVVIGTATSFGLPFTAGFKEVHESNMTKTSKAASHDGNKGKELGFRKADIEKVIAEHRK